jgi:hypothetical protein
MATGGPQESSAFTAVPLETPRIPNQSVVIAGSLALIVDPQASIAMQ